MPRLTILIAVILAATASGTFAQEPHVVSVTPSLNALNIAPNSAISIVFDQDMDASSITPTSLVVNGTITGRHSGDIEYDVPSMTVRFVSNRAFARGETVGVVVTKSIRSAAQVPLVQGRNWGFVVTAAYQGSVSYRSPVTMPCGSDPNSICAADLNRDGSIDLITANRVSSNVSVFLGQQDGTFAAGTSYSTGALPYVIRAADLTGDGVSDLVTSNCSHETVSVLVGNGDGSFQPYVAYDVSTCTEGVAVVDIDSDGDLDVCATSTGTDQLFVLLNAGNGQLMVTTSYVVGDFPTYVIGADLNGDFSVDLATANRDAGSICWLANNGSGVFSAPMFTTTGSGTHSLATADMDSDGDLDIATANKISNDVSVLLNDGSGGFGNPTKYPVGSAPHRITMGDFDGDGAIDAITAAHGSTDALLCHNDGNGNLSSPLTVYSGSNPVETALGDFDNDGDLDLAVANFADNTVSVLINDGDIRQPRTIRVPSEQPTIQAGIDAALNGDTVLVADGTYTGDGNRDVVIGNKTIVVMSEHGPASTTIDCQATETDQHGGFYVQSLYAEVTLKGFAITGARAVNGGAICGSQSVVEIDSCIFTGNVSGCYFVESDVVMFSCVSTGNYGYGVTADRSCWLQMKDCVISNNALGGLGTVGNGCSLQFDRNLFSANNGPGLYLQNGTAVINECVFADNLRGVDGTTEAGRLSIEVSRSRFVNNSIDSAGGGMRVHFGEDEGLSGGSLVVDECLFEDNSAELGGAISTDGRYSGQYRIVRCTFRGNNASRGGAIAIDSWWDTPEIESCTFVSNTAIEGSALYLGTNLATYYVSVSRCIFESNQGIGVVRCNDGFNSVFVRCSDCFSNYNEGQNQDWVGCIEGQYGQNGNISLDPLFCDTANGNYSLYSFSPCAAANNSCGQLIGAYDVGCTLAATLALPNESTATNVMSHTPTLGWTFEPAPGWTQTDFEIAVGTDNNWAYAEMWNPAPFVSTNTSVVYAGAALVDGTTYYARVRSKLNGIWTAWTETSFRMNSLPIKPTMATPQNGAVTGQQPTLYANNSVDSEADPLSYQFEVYTDPNSQIPLAVSDLVTQEQDSTGWTVNAILPDNAFYFWRVRAWDGYEYSDWSVYNFFAVNSSPEAPSTPTVTAPVGTNLILYDMLPSFSWTKATDPDPFDEVKYRLELSLNQNFTLVVPFDNLTDTAYFMADSLLFSQRYWWRVKAIDKSGLFSTSTPSDFWTWTLGDVNRSHDCTIGDIALLIDHLFIAGTPIDPPKTGDVNGSCDITIGDISVMIDRLFISGAQLKVGCE